MAEAAILSVGLGIVQEILGSGLLKEFEMICGVRGDVESLESKFTTLQSVLADANDLRVKNRSVDNWLKKVRDVTYQVDDVLDDFRFEALRREAETGNHALKKVRDFFSKSNQLVFLLRMGRKLKKVRDRLDLIADERLKYHLKESTQAIPYARAVIKERETVSTNSDPIIGREKEKEKIIQLLMTEVPNDEVFSVIPIVGMGGVGKTTLAQLVYNDDVVKNTFDLPMWVCVSEDFNVKKLTKLLIDEASQTTRSERENQSATNIESLQQLHQRLQEKLSGKKFLLVLDDVWNVQWGHTWDQLKGFLKTGAKGSKIVVTTRFKEVASRMGENESCTLEVLSDECCWELFEKKALCGRREEKRLELVPIGREIVKKCRGSPLAAKALGSLMVVKEDRSDWIVIRDSEIWCSGEVGDEILPSLMLSYHHLPPHLKPCFVYCALFSKDDEMDGKTLIWLWMAEGLIPHSNDQMAKGLIPHSNYQNSEDIGKGYLKELVSRSLFQSNEYDGYYVHDLVHDLAKRIAGDACLTMQVGRSIKIPRFCYCLTLISDENTTACPKEFRQTESVRTLIFKSDKHEQFGFEEVCHEMLIIPSKLRALHFQYCPLRELSDSISNLKHLRYIHLSNGRFKALPQSIGSLQNLQILAISYCVNLASLPASLGGLLSLQILTISGCRDLASLPTSLDGLLNLQVLVVECCNQFESMPSSIGDLQNLNVLRIIQCSKLQLLPESMKKLQKLDCLDLSGTNLQELPSGMSNMTNLRNLDYYGFHQLTHMPKEMKKLNKLQKLPIFVVDEERGSSIAELQHLQLEGEQKILSLEKLKDPIAARAANLKEKGGLQRLHLFKGRSEGESLGDVAVEVLEGLEPPQNICELRMSGGTEFPRWLNMGESSYPKLDHISLFHFSRCKHLPPLGQLLLLKTLDIYGMSLIEVVGREFCGDNGDDVAFPSLDKITFREMPTWKKWLISEEEDGIARQQSMAFTSLTQLKISDCPELTSLPSLPSLQMLEIHECPKLALLPSLPSLQMLDIDECPKLALLPSLPTLQNLNIHQCPELALLPSLPSLQQLDIYSCPKLTSLPSLSSLQRLDIFRCLKLTSLPSLPSLQMLRINVLCILPTSPTSFQVSNINSCLELTSLPSLPSLQELHIDCCPELTSLPSLSSLQRLDIICCLKLTSLPSLPSLQMLKISAIHLCQPSLTFLQESNINSCPQLTSLPSLPSLQTLHINSCPKLTLLHNLPSLQELNINSCPKLTLLPSLPSLEKLTVENSIELLKSEGSLRGVGSLKCLNITGDGEEVGVMKGLQDLSSVEELNITGFGELACVMESMQHLLSTVQTLIIISNAMTVLPETMRGLVSLRCLLIVECESLSSLGEGLRGLTALKDLDIHCCRDLGCMPEYMGSLTSLQSLSITRCPNLSRKCEREKGEDWHLISHIPNIIISPRYEEEATDDPWLKKKVISVVKERLRSCFPSTSST